SRPLIVQNTTGSTDRNKPSHRSASSLPVIHGAEVTRRDSDEKPHRGIANAREEVWQPWANARSASSCILSHCETVLPTQNRIQVESSNEQLSLLTPCFFWLKDANNVGKKCLL
ncbi:hypothetical protein ANANG_G00251550, partial [Anguilla anguilla]